MAYLAAGQREQALAVVGRVKQETPDTADDGLAGVYAALGDRDAAIRVLENSYRRHQTTFPWIRVGKLHDLLGDDPRFQDLLRRMKLPL